jgi:hypothetical protein
MMHWRAKYVQHLHLEKSPAFKLGTAKHHNPLTRLIFYSKDIPVSHLNGVLRLRLLAWGFTSISFQPARICRSADLPADLQGVILFSIGNRRWTLDLSSGTGSIKEGDADAEPDVELEMTGKPHLLECCNNPAHTHHDKFATISAHPV